MGLRMKNPHYGPCIWVAESFPIIARINWLIKVCLTQSKNVRRVWFKERLAFNKIRMKTSNIGKYKFFKVIQSYLVYFLLIITPWFFINTYMEELVLYWIQYKNSLNVWKIQIQIQIQIQCLKNVIHQIDNKNE